MCVCVREGRKLGSTVLKYLVWLNPSVISRLFSDRGVCVHVVWLGPGGECEDVAKSEQNCVLSLAGSLSLLSQMENSIPCRCKFNSRKNTNVDVSAFNYAVRKVCQVLLALIMMQGLSKQQVVAAATSSLPAE